MGSPESVTWRYSEEKEAEIFYLALASRSISGVQQATAVLDHPIGNHEHLHNTTFATHGHDLSQLKKSFVDHFAELLARKKDARFISADILAEQEAETVVYAFRNGGVYDKIDRNFFLELSASIPKLNQRYTSERSDQLFTTMLNYYIERFAFHAFELSQYFRSLRKRPGYRTAGQAKLLAELRRMVEACETFYSRVPYNIPSAAEITSLAHELTKMSHARGMARLFVGKHVANELRRLIGFVAQIRVIHQTIVTSARRLNTFASFRVELIRLPQQQCSTRFYINVANEFAYQSLVRLNLAVPEPMKSSRFEDELLPEYSKKLIIHAEMQALFFALKPQNAGLNLFRYIGVSKELCYNCATLFRELDIFGTRPGHGHICPHWTLPRYSEIRRDYLRRTAIAIDSVREGLANLICQPKRRKLPRLHQSTASAPIVAQHIGATRAAAGSILGLHQAVQDAVSLTMNAE